MIDDDDERAKRAGHEVSGCFVGGLWIAGLYAVLGGLAYLCHCIGIM